MHQLMLLSVFVVVCKSCELLCSLHQQVSFPPLHLPLIFVISVLLMLMKTSVNMLTNCDYHIHVVLCVDCTVAYVLA